MQSKHSRQQRNQHQIKSTKKETKAERVVIQSQNNYSFRLGKARMKASQSDLDRQDERTKQNQMNPQAKPKKKKKRKRKMKCTKQE